MSIGKQRACADSEGRASRGGSVRGVAALGIDAGFTDVKRYRLFLCVTEGLFHLVDAELHSVEEQLVVNAPVLPDTKSDPSIAYRALERTTCCWISLTPFISFLSKLPHAHARINIIVPTKSEHPKAAHTCEPGMLVRALKVQRGLLYAGDATL